MVVPRTENITNTNILKYKSLYEKVTISALA